MKKIRSIIWGMLLGLLVSCSTNSFDIVIKDGRIYDGTGNKPYTADIGIKEGRIIKIGKNLSSNNSATIINAENFCVSPGFIDIHTHCDTEILDSGMNSIENYLKQGVTTVVTGNCGTGTFHVKEFFHQLDSIGTGPNVIHLAGHNYIRAKAMDMSNRKPTEEEMDSMKIMVREAMEGGAAGISTGLFYTPGNYSETSEIVELANIVKQYDGFYASHLRDESNYTVGLEEAVKEAISIGKQTGVRVEISHIKALGKPVWGISRKICKLIEEAQNEGIYVMADQYPYNASNNGLSDAVVPAWAHADNRLKQNLSNPQLLPRLRKEIAENIERRGGPETLVIVAYPEDTRFNGKNLSEIGAIIDKDPVETVIHLLSGDFSPGVVSFNMNDSDVIHFMKKDYVMTSSDGNIEVPGNGTPHPRSYGAFPRKIRKYVFEDKIISLEQAIKKATSMPAEMIGMKERGYLKINQIADIVIFDPETIRDNATFDKPHQYSSGIKYLLINGKLAINDEQYNGMLAGKAIRLGNGKSIKQEQ